MFVKSIVLYIGLFSIINGEKTGYVFTEQVQGWIKLHETPVTITDALILCDIEDGFLADLRDVQMRSGIETYLSQVNKNINEIFTWRSKEVISGINSSSECEAWSIKDGTVKNVTRAHKLPFICFKNKLVFNKCGETDLGYTYEPKSQNCYKFHLDVQTWNNAYSTCRAEGGYLAIVNSQSESNVLKDIFARYPHEKLSTEPSNIFIGFRDWLDGDSWKTVEGETLEEAGYSTWSPEQPNGRTLNISQYCGALTRFQDFNDMRCDVPIHYICEKTPSNDDRRETW